MYFFFVLLEKLKQTFSSDPLKTSVSAGKTSSVGKKVGLVFGHLENVFSRDQNWDAVQCSVSLCCWMSHYVVSQKTWEKEPVQTYKKGCVSIECLFTQDSLIHVCCLGVIISPRIIISRVPFYSAKYPILDNKICDYPSYILSKLGQSALFLKI